MTAHISSIPEKTRGHRPRLELILLAALVVQIPFEFRREVLGLSNLQWTFIALFLVCVPSLLSNLKLLVRQRAVQAAAVFVAIQWCIALLAPEFQMNAVKGAIRFSAGLILLGIGCLVSKKNRTFLQATWVVAAGVAAFYSLLSYLGVGLPSLFRTEEFYIGQVQRLSGSFEYPNTAAAYFAMSLPIIWWSGVRPWLKWGIAFLLWCALVLTFSRGALLAVPIAVAVGLVSSYSGMKWRPAVGLLALGVGACAVLLPVNPYFMELVYGPMHNPLGVEYKTGWNHLQQQPNRLDEIPVEIRNVGITTWRATGLWRSAVSYRWWNIASETFVWKEPIITQLPHDITRGETAKVSLPFRTPPEPGKYLLVIELFSRDYDWYSRTGVIPALVLMDIQPDVARTANEIDMSPYYYRRQMPRVFTAGVPRSDLWRAALRMTRAHPFGVGPDNYRLEYGKYLGALKWDTEVYSNDLLLEILTGSGILGLAAFVWFLFAIPWRFDGESLSIGIFLIHGLVDVFLMATPIYFCFWLLTGTRLSFNYGDRDPV